MLHPQLNILSKQFRPLNPYLTISLSRVVEGQALRNHSNRHGNGRQVLIPRDEPGAVVMNHKQKPLLIRQGLLLYALRYCNRKIHNI